jgi:hypothetical protein
MIRVPIHVDYGAEQYYWYAPFQTEQEVCNWWLVQTDLDLYSKITTNPEEVLIGTVSAVSKDQLDDFDQEYNMDSPITAHLDNDYNSYLIINQTIYFHQGFKGKKWTINPEAQPVLRLFDDSDDY